MCSHVRGLTPALRSVGGGSALVDLAKVGAPHSKLINPYRSARVLRSRTIPARGGREGHSEGKSAQPYGVQ